MSFSGSRGIALSKPNHRYKGRGTFLNTKPLGSLSDAIRRNRLESDDKVLSAEARRLGIPVSRLIAQRLEHV